MRLVYSPDPRRSLPGRIGDLVELNSGGPKMLVVDILENKLTCAWVNHNIIDEDDFSPVCLKFVF